MKTDGRVHPMCSNLAVDVSLVLAMVASVAGYLVALGVR